MMSHFFLLLRVLAGRRPARATRPGQAFALLALLLAAPLLGRAQYSAVTFDPKDITVNSATLGGRAFYNGNLTSPSGIAYRQGSGDPTTADMVAPVTLLPTNPCQTCYTAAVRGLLPGKQYQARAFIVTPTGETYGATITFETPPLPYQSPLPPLAVTPAGPLVLGGGGTLTLAASLTLPGFNLTGTGFDGEVTAVLLQPDGKVLVGGSFTTYNDNPTAPARVLRFLADGALDVGFNPGGAGPSGAVRTLAVQPDGKILVGGDFTTYNGTAAPGRLLRLNADGSPDATFNSGGSGFNGTVNVLVRQPDGKALVGGTFTTYNGTAAPGRVLRLNADGSLDATFNHPNGQVGIGANGGGNSVGVNALVRQPDGKVLVGGAFNTYNSAPAPGRLLRLNADGSLDVTFNHPNGQVGFGTTGPVNALLLQPNGQVLVGGTFTTYNSNATAPDRLMRLNADGSLDATFNSGGSGFDNGANGVRVLLVQPNGQVLAGGTFTSYNGDASAPDCLLRLNADGSLDTGFNYGPATGISGVVGGTNPSPVNALALQPDGKLLAGGSFTTYNGNADAPDNLLRLNADGSLDTALSVVTAADGLTLTWSTGATGPTLAVSQPGDYQVTATRQGRLYYSRVVRVSAPPATTVQVAPGGPLVLPTGGSIPLTATATRPGFNVGGTGFNGDVNAVVLQPDGKVLVGGTFTTYNGAPVPNGLVRLNPDGSLDTGFTSGLAGPTPKVHALALQVDGKIVVGSAVQVAGSAGAAYSSTTGPVTLVRLNPNGSLDTSFTVGRALIARISQDLSNYNTQTGAYELLFIYDNIACIYSLAIQPDGKIVVGGKFNSYNGDFRQQNVRRLNPDGSLDASFNYGGNGVSLVLTQGGVSDQLEFVRAVALLPNGKIVVGGNFNTLNGQKVCRSLLVLNDDGTRDYGFNLGYSVNGSGGIMHFDYPEDAGLVWALAVQPDGKILVGGQFQQWNNSASSGITANRLVRLNPDGTYDASFYPPGTGYLTNYDDKHSNTPVRALAVQPDGKIVIGGQFQQYYNRPSSPLVNKAYDRNYVLRLEPNGGLDPTTDFSHPAGQYGANSPVYALALQPDGQVLLGGAFTAYDGNAAAPDHLLRLTPAGLLNDAATPLAGATYAFNPSNSSGNSFAASQPGTYTATATDPATGFTYGSNAVTITSAPLPVELLTFTATLAGPAAVRLAWVTASEVNSQSFEVERSLDGRTFARIGTVAAAGSSSSARSYGLLDAQLPAGATLLYYRLRQVDQDGTFRYSPVRAVALSGAAAGLALFPNPAHGGAATLTGTQPGAVVTVLDALGRPVASVIADAAGTAALVLPAGLATGVYVVRTGSKALRLLVE
ncbi:MAG: hypothetical protein ACRYFX_00110 [Janthinobacterium lividum]